MDNVVKLVFEIAKIGKSNKTFPPIKEVKPFHHFFIDDRIHELNELDGPWTRREIVARYLLLNAVLDQGPDVIGVRELLKDVTNNLYKNEIRIFHRPLDFFKELNISIDNILLSHKSIKEIRSKDWAKTNNSNPERYNLFFAQSQRGLISINEILDYSVHRWGVPLSVPYLLEKDLSIKSKISVQPLIDYLESFESAEIMAQQLKSNERYGLGSALGDKASHLFSKWYIHTFQLNYRKDDGWSEWSYETPFDSNAGRVLFRTGFLLSVADLRDYIDWGVIQKNKGKSGKNYIRVTNIRGKKSTKLKTDDLMKNYNEVVIHHMKIRERISNSFEIQKLPNAFLLKSEYGIGDFDDGLMFIGTNYCFNNEKPNCVKCPIRNSCYAFQKDRSLIEDFTT
ncbi:hypothetical protein [Athalassotoga sp.]|uniref:hypothetical protein n=1 Tax=Athalassotoga sp. TaxID=2022597 RepID=UPI003D023BEE